MEEKPRVDLHVEASDGGLKELVLRWFTDTQAPLILNNGNFPDWFQGFSARKETEDLLRDKAPGCFLIRLSDKAIGYILSYKGHDRCRHFVIVQNQTGQFVISGDSHTYGSITELIEHHKVSPIQPFGEYLTSSCYKVDIGELYDVVNYNTKGKSGLSVQALKTLWDQKNDRQNNPSSNLIGHQQNEPLTLIPPALPPKTKSRKLTGVVSVDTLSLSPNAPPVPKRGLPLSLSLSGSYSYMSHASETQADTNRMNKLTPDRDSFQPDMSYLPAITYSELTPVESRSKSLPRLNNIKEREEESSDQISSSSFTSYSPSPLKSITCHSYSIHDPRCSLSNSRSEQQTVDVEMSQSNPLYQDSEWSSELLGSYAEVHQRSTPSGLADDPYEQTPGEDVHGNTYESLEDMKTKKSKSTWGKNNKKWKKFLPDYKRK
ncbi:SH2 domain-containing protein 7 [Antennarius striatus]|uniref:SH2 domain-containing protein 7 n=1 Tax=Antennarius striatus TaxID=241820 RepID=UPI0035AE4E6F